MAADELTGTTAATGAGEAPTTTGGTQEAATSLATTSAFGAGALLVAMGGSATGGLPVPAPYSQPICIVEGTHVAGTTHVAGIRELAAGLAEGTRLRLERDPVNRRDRWSIRVLDGQGRRLGFVPVDVNEVPARLMDGGKRLYAQVRAVEQRGGWTRVGMDVYLDD